MIYIKNKSTLDLKKNALDFNVKIILNCFQGIECVNLDK